MQIYEFILKPKSSVALNSQTAFPVQSDTLMGHLFWQLYYDKGETALLKLKKELENGAKLAVSSAFPTGYLPLPNLPLRINDSSDQAQNLQEYQKRKKLKKVKWLKIDYWPTLSNSLNSANLSQLIKEDSPSAPWQNSSTIKVSINRNNFKALEGQLYTVQEYYFDIERFKTLSLYFAADCLDKEAFSHYLEHALLNGYGKKASTGKGYLEIVEEKEANLPNAENANAFMVLGNYYPTEAEIKEHKFAGFYTLNTKFGKLGDAKAKSSNPFKFPHIVFEPGSIFKATPKSPVVGRIIKNISKSEPEVWQHCQTLCVGVHLNGE